MYGFRGVEEVLHGLLGLKVPIQGSKQGGGD